MKKTVYGLGSCLCVALALVTGACVDDYDLSEDIDLTVKVGGDSFSIPASSTDVITLSKILDLDDNSSIREASQGEFGLNEGDYVLVQEGDRTDSKFQIGDVTINDLSHNTAHSDELLFVYSGNNKVTASVNPTVNNITLRDDNVTSDLVSASIVDMDVEMDFTIGYTSSTDFTGTAYIEQGYTAVFDPAWYLEIDPASASVIRLTDHNVIEFTKRVGITKAKPLSLRLFLTKADLTQVPDGQGLYERGHFYLSSDIVSEGEVTIENWENASYGTTEKLQLVTTTDLVSALITGITGVIDPEIKVDDTQFSINDIPDFLKDDDNSLNVDNPRFYVTVTNNSPVEMELNAQLASFSNDTPDAPFAEVGIGAAYGTRPVLVGANGSTEILISQKAIPGSGSTNIVVDNLSDLIRTIPDFMRFEKVQCHAVQEEVKLELEPEYRFYTDYEAIIPLSFGTDMRLHYTSDETEWDLDDIDKYNFDKVKISFTAVNTIPLNMTPHVIALDSQNNEIENITATVTGEVFAGTVAAAASSQIEVLLQSDADNLGRLDGVRLVFDATSDADHIGDNLNSAQSLRFEDIKLEIIGGVTIDLND